MCPHTILREPVLRDRELVGSFSFLALIEHYLHRILQPYQLIASWSTSISKGSELGTLGRVYCYKSLLCASSKWSPSVARREVQ